MSNWLPLNELVWNTFCPNKRMATVESCYLYQQRITTRSCSLRFVLAARLKSPWAVWVFFSCIVCEETKRGKRSDQTRIPDLLRPASGCRNNTKLVINDRGDWTKKKEPKFKKGGWHSREVHFLLPLLVGPQLQSQAPPPSLETVYSGDHKCLSITSPSLSMGFISVSGWRRKAAGQILEHWNIFNEITRR